jgi:diacylglycerol kinase
MSFIQNRIHAFKHSFKGLSYFFKNETHAKIHSIGALCAVGFGALLQISISDWCWISLAIFTVFITEILNTSLEKVVDLISLEKSELAKKAKDLGAAAVLLSSLFSVIIGVLVFQAYL